MKIISLIICTFSLAIVNSQNVIEYLKDNGFFIESNSDKSFGQVSAHYDLENVFGGEYAAKKTEKDKITSSQLQACLDGNIFKYYESLYKYNTPLKQKLFKEDYPTTYAEYQAKLSDAKLFYETSGISELNPFDLKSYSEFFGSDLLCDG